LCPHKVPKRLRTPPARIGRRAHEPTWYYAGVFELTR
jgi:hypothetical protein